jgi:hypothetical protein
MRPISLMKRRNSPGLLLAPTGSDAMRRTAGATSS